MRRLARRLGHLHFNDNFGKEDDHLPIGAGTIDFHEILRQLEKGRYEDTLAIEVFCRDRDCLRTSREKIQVMWLRWES